VSRILLVEDEPRITAFLEKGLRAEGHATTAVQRGEDAVSLLLSGEVDLVVLDLGLPGMDGYEVLRRMRGAGRSEPVIILTARDTVEDTVAGLDLGADDYLTKPFRFEELLARVRARLRGRPDAMETVLSTAAVSLDLRTRRAAVDGRDVNLTAREYALLEVFLRHPGQVLSREQLLSHVWGYDFDPGSNVVDVYVRYLRRKLGADAIETVRGMGYRLSD
jgi:two-component system, OmpR family, copper resistance phosphate regulon response regulator CusR